MGTPMGTTGYETPDTTREDPAGCSKGDRRAMTFASWMDRPLWEAGASWDWVAATAVFFAWVRLFGGPAYVDAVESVYSNVGHCPRTSGMCISSGNPVPLRRHLTSHSFHRAALASDLRWSGGPDPDRPQRSVSHFGRGWVLIAPLP